MLNNVVLDVFIGLVFIFLLYSLLATTLQEIVARWLGLRGRMLQKSIRRMLEDEDSNNLFGVNRRSSILLNAIAEIMAGIGRYFKPFFSSDSGFARAFFDHPAIRSLSESSWNSKPSYISPDNFSDTVIQLLRGQNYDGSIPQMNHIKIALFDDGQYNAVDGSVGNIPPETLKLIKQLFLDGQNDAARFKARLEQWFNDTQDRATGWYKKQTQLILFLIGLLLALSFNVDTISIYRKLAKDKDVRNQIVNMAVNAPAKYGALIDTLKKSTQTAPVTIKKANGKDTTIFQTTTQYTLSDTFLNNTYKSLRDDAAAASQVLGLGRTVYDSCELCKNPPCMDCLDKLIDSVSRHRIDSALRKCEANKKKRKIFQYTPEQEGGLVTFLGFVLTAIAISLGAPFWFDLLNKFILLRSSGPKPSAKDSGSANAANPGTQNIPPTERVG